MLRPCRIVVALLFPIAAAAQSKTSTITGVVFDSLVGTPLAGALVQLYGASDSVANRMFSTKSDSLGKFRLDTVPYGAYLAGFFHPSVDSLGIEAKPRAVRVSEPTQRVDLTSPSAAQLIAALCPAERTPDSTALLFGHVRRADSEEPVVDAAVRLEWFETVIDQAEGARNIEHGPQALTQQGGWFAFCGVPSGVPIRMRATIGGDSSGFIEHQSVAYGAAHLTFLVGHAQRVVVTDPATGDTVRLLRGAAQLTGLVLTDKGQPAPSAQLEIVGTGASARTSDAGRFSFDSLPNGTYTLSSRAIGYAPVDEVVQLAEGRPATAEVRLRVSGVMLAGVEIRATVVYSSKLAQFENHRRRGVSGRFFQPITTNGHEVLPLVEYLRQVPNMYVERSPIGDYSLYIRRTHGVPGPCVPLLYLNGTRSMLDFDMFNGSIHADEILGVEVYSSTLGLPAEFFDPRNEGCGVIAVWTKPRLSKPQDP